MKRASATLKSAIRGAKHRRKKRESFPYARVHRMWDAGKKIQEIAKAIGRIDKDNPNDPYHSLRNFLYRMHKGYKNRNGQVVRLKHRVSVSTIREARKAGLKGPPAAQKNRRLAAKALAAKAA
jgi:hypothetical protein